MMPQFIKQLRREILIYSRQIPLLLNTFILYLIFIAFFPLTLPPDILLIRTVLPAMVWMAVLLVSLLSAERMFHQDYEQGVLEQWLVTEHYLPLLVVAKVLIYWLFNILTLLSLCPIIAFLFALSLKETAIMALSLICATPALFFLCALAVVFGISAQQKGALMALILLPLTLPVMIFGSGSITMALQGLPVSGYLAILTAISLTALSLLPFAIAAVIRISLVD